MKFLPPLQSQDSMLAAVCYPLGVVASPYVFFSDKKDDPFVYFHAIQGLVVNLLAILLFLLGFLFFFVFSKSSPTYTQISTGGAGGWSDSYMGSGCFFSILMVGAFIFYFMLFLSLIFCASKVWNGDDIRIPFIGGYIEMKYFREYMDDDDIRDESRERNNSPLSLPTQRHDLPFRR